jgi:hypothetical protein
VVLYWWIKVNRAVLVGANAFLIPLGAFLLWFYSLKSINIRQMSDLGLVSVMSPVTIVALAIVTVSFCLHVWQPEKRAYIFLLHLILLIFMLYGVTTIVEEAPRFATVYRHAGYTDYIMRTGTVNPWLDASFSWPGFFIVSALLTKVAGYHDILSYAGWAPVFLNMISLGPLYLIFTSATDDKRIIWLGLWFFYLTNWIGQDYYSPQGLNFVLFLVILAILLTWFKARSSDQQHLKLPCWGCLGRYVFFARQVASWLTAPDPLVTSSSPSQRRALLTILIVVFVFVVGSHPLTPFIIIVDIAFLVLFRRITPGWFPVLMGAIVAVWLAFMAQPYLMGRAGEMISALVSSHSSVVSDVTARMIVGNPAHNFIATMRLLMTLLVWGLAVVGVVYRLRRGYRDATSVLLAAAPFLLFLVQPYGGEMLMQIYLFTLPLMIFFVAAFCIGSFLNLKSISLWRKGATLGLCLLLLGGFLFTRYGNERMDYVTHTELDGVRYLYRIAPSRSLLIAAWSGTPWEFQNYEQYTHNSLDESEALVSIVERADATTIVSLIENTSASSIYIIFTRTQRANADNSGLPSGALDRLERALLASRKFRQIYSNPDAQILIFTGDIKGNVS